uniref:Putative splicing regulatory glutamine/lysine-rich protein 1 isoform x17 n=1 Tax=Panstrongylus lignarius TaxID=156445 RepID=A0A224XUM1_9HEMI
MGKYSSDSESGSSSSYRRKKSDRGRKGRHRSSSRSSSGSKYTSKSRRSKKSKKNRRSRSRERHSKHSRRHSRDRHRRSRSSSSKRSRRSRSRSKSSRSYSRGVSPWSKNRGRSSRSSSHRRSRSYSRGRRRYSRSRTRTRSISPRRSDSRNINKSNECTSKYSPNDDGSELLEKLNKAAVLLMSEKAKETSTSIESQVQREAIINEINAPTFAPKIFISNDNKSDDLPAIVEIPSVPTKLTTIKEEPGSLLHPNVCLLLEDQEEKLNRWVRKVYQIRQRSLNGEPLALA